MAKISTFFNSKKTKIQDIKFSLRSSEDRDGENIAVFLGPLVVLEEWAGFVEL